MMIKNFLFFAILIPFAAPLFAATPPCTDLADCQVKLLQAQNELVKYRAMDIIKNNDAAIEALQAAQKKTAAKPAETSKKDN